MDAKRLKELDGAVDVVAVHYPGRTTRTRDPPAESMIELGNAVRLALMALPDPVPTVFFGHSFGARLAHATLSRLQDEAPPSFVLKGDAQDALRKTDGEMVVALCASSSCPPTCGPCRTESLALAEAHTHTLVEAMLNLGGTGEAQRHDEAVMEYLAQAVVPALRADLRLIGGYDPAAGAARMPAVGLLSVVHGSNERRLLTVDAPTENQHEGREHWAGAVRAARSMPCLVVPGGHFHFTESPGNMHSLAAHLLSLFTPLGM